MKITVKAQQCRVHLADPPQNKTIKYSYSEKKKIGIVWFTFNHLLINVIGSKVKVYNGLKNEL